MCGLEQIGDFEGFYMYETMSPFDSYGNPEVSSLNPIAYPISYLTMDFLELAGWWRDG